jgi:hypothetical protein
LNSEIELFVPTVLATSAPAVRRSRNWSGTDTRCVWSDSPTLDGSALVAPGHVTRDRREREAGREFAVLQV